MDKGNAEEEDLFFDEDIDRAIESLLDQAFYRLDRKLRTKKKINYRALSGLTEKGRVRKPIKSTSRKKRILVLEVSV